MFLVVCDLFCHLFTLLLWYVKVHTLVSKRLPSSSKFIYIKYLPLIILEGEVVRLESSLSLWASLWKQEDYVRGAPMRCVVQRRISLCPPYVTNAKRPFAERRQETYVRGCYAVSTSVRYSERYSPSTNMPILFLVRNFLNFGHILFYVDIKWHWK